MRGCVYCGYPLDGGAKLTCSKHSDLPDLDPEWEDFVADLRPPAPGGNRCVHCGDRTRGRLVFAGEQVECDTCWWLVRYSRDELLEMAAALDFLASAIPTPYR